MMSDSIQCDLAELVDRGIYTDDDAIEHIKAASDYVVKTSQDAPSIMQLFANPVLAPIARQHGFASFTPGGPTNLYEKLLYEQQLQDKMRAAQMAAQSDRGTYVDTIRGLAAITGQEWTPERASAAEQFAKQIANVSPMLMQLNPGLFEQLHGRRGSAALMASRMMDTAQQFGTNPEHAAAVSSLVRHNLARDPTWASGLSAGEVGSLYKQMYMRGMIPSGNSRAAAGALRDMSAPMAVLKELGGTGSMEELESVAPGMMSQIPPRELAFRLREQGILSKSPNIYGAQKGMHKRLMGGAATSRLANQIGATLRLGSVAGFKVDPEDIADMNTGEWINYMKRKGVSPSQARSALGAVPANKEFIFRRNIAPLVYSKQRDELSGNLNRYFGKDVGATLLDLPRNVMMDGRKRNRAISKSLNISPIEAETLWGRANTMMSRAYGMDAWDVNKLYNRGTLDMSRRFRDEAADRADLGSYYAGYLPNSPTQAFFESIQNAGPDTNLMDVASRTAGMVPIDELPPPVSRHRMFDKRSGDTSRLKKLKEAKKESDRKNYAAKHDILRKLLKDHPDEFVTDSEKNNTYGITHVPTGFRMHVPKTAIPGVKKADLPELLRDVTDSVALFSARKETADKRKEEQEENRRLLKAVERNKRERKARRLATSQDKMDLMLGKTSDHKGWRIDKSDIAGKGVISTSDFGSGDIITDMINVLEKSDKYPWKPEYQQTDACRYMNHTRKPNAELVRDGDVFNLVAIDEIPNGIEITVNYGDANREMGSGYHYTHKGKDYVTEDSDPIESIVMRDELLNLLETASTDNKK
jgi:hypothetical protein